jgi:hypothetical protein
LRRNGYARTLERFQEWTRQEAFVELWPARRRTSSHISESGQPVAEGGASIPSNRDRGTDGSEQSRQQVSPGGEKPFTRDWARAKDQGGGKALLELHQNRVRHKLIAPRRGNNNVETRSVTGVSKLDRASWQGLDKGVVSDYNYGKATA